jgi:hypothetical protein
MLIGGGIGVTPFASILKSIRFRLEQTGQSTIQKVPPKFFPTLPQRTQIFPTKFFFDKFSLNFRLISTGFAETRTVSNGSVTCSLLSNKTITTIS